MVTIISTVGTSLLTNDASSDDKSFLQRTANHTVTDLSETDKQRIDSRAQQVAEALAQASDADAQDRSAELHGIISGGWIGGDCQHFLLHTDTYQGEKAAEILAEYLRNRGVAFAAPIKLCKLRTSNQEDFRAGIDALLTWCDETLPGYSNSGNKIVFSLVGGFKSLQAYAQVIGMIYADEICYIFENSSELLRIPRLPIAFDRKPLEDHAALLARLIEGPDIVSRSAMTGIPESYLDIDGDDAAISTWGKLAWDSNKHAILSKRLLDQPGLKYEPSFKKDFDKATPQSRVELQETLARVSVLWREGGLGKLRADGGLQYSDMKINGGVGHFRVNLSERVTCVPDGDTLCLRHYGDHDVEKNP